MLRNFQNPLHSVGLYFPQKVYNLSKAKFSRFEGTRGDKNPIFRTLICKQQKGSTELSDDDSNFRYDIIKCLVSLWILQCFLHQKYLHNSKKVVCCVWKTNHIMITNLLMPICDVICALLHRKSGRHQSFLINKVLFHF